MKFFLSVTAVCVVVLLFAPQHAFAQTVEDQYQDILDQGIIFANICDSKTADCPCRDNGECELEDILQVLVNVGVFVLAISGSAALLLFVYGGFTWLISQGNANMIEAGKKTMIGAVIGLIIVFSSYAAITFLISVLKTGEAPDSTRTLEEVIGSGKCSGDSDITCTNDSDCGSDGGVCVGNASDIINTVTE